MKILLIAFLLCVTGSHGLSCLPCSMTEEYECSPLPYHGCEHGISLAVCGCCSVCSKGLGDSCGGTWNTHGSCGTGLECKEKVYWGYGYEYGICRQKGAGSNITSSTTVPPTSLTTEMNTSTTSSRATSYTTGGTTSSKSTTNSPLTPPPIEELPPCAAGDFRCLSDQKCIDSLRVCDLVQDCPQNEDEIACNRECPEGFVPFDRQTCLHIHTFPRRWLRAKQWCTDIGSSLASFKHDDSTHHKLLEVLMDNSFLGWNFWIGSPLLSSSLISMEKRNITIPFWMLNGKQCTHVITPVQSGLCLFLDHSNIKPYLASNCNDHAGFICQINI